MGVKTSTKMSVMYESNSAGFVASVKVGCDQYMYEDFPQTLKILCLPIFLTL